MQRTDHACMVSSLNVSFSKYMSKKIQLLLVYLSLAISLSIVFIFEPGKNSFYPICFFHRFTGLYCPACGSTRALYHFLHGNFIEALHANIFIVVFIAFLIYSTLTMTDTILNNKRHSLKLPRYSVLIIGIVLVLFWIIRNIPAFSFLTPH